MPFIEDESEDGPTPPTPKPPRPAWMDACPTTKIPYPPGFDVRKTGEPVGNPNLIAGSQAAHENAVKYSFQPGPDPRRAVGGIVRPENKSIRIALIKLMDEPVKKVSKLRNKADQVALKLYTLSQSPNGRDALNACKEIADRIDGRSAPSVQELNALSRAAPAVVLIDNRMRPDRSEPLIIQHEMPVLSASLDDDEPNDEQEDES